MSNFSFSCSVFLRLVPQKCEYQVLFGNGLKVAKMIISINDMFESIEKFPIVFKCLFLRGVVVGYRMKATAGPDLA